MRQREFTVTRARNRVKFISGIFEEFIEGRRGDTEEMVAAAAEEQVMEKEEKKEEDFKGH